MNNVMLVSPVLCTAIAIWRVVDPDSMTGAAQWLVNYSLTALDWYFLALCTAFLVIMGFMAFSRYGNMGARRPSLADFLLGPNSARVAHHAGCSVSVVREWPIHQPGSINRLEV